MPCKCACRREETPLLPRLAEVQQALLDLKADLDRHFVDALLASADNLSTLAAQLRDDVLDYHALVCAAQEKAQ